MVTLLVENGIWFDLTLFGAGTSACCTTFPSAASYNSRASPARYAGRTFGPTPTSSLCDCFCRNHFIANFR